MISETETPAEGYYFVGIGGVSMSALARLIRDRGFRVRGSDEKESDTTRALRAEGIPVFIGTGQEISERTVVYTGAVEADHPQLCAARGAGKRLVARAEFLGEIAEEYPHVLSVAGCHGKTTASCMLSHIFLAGNRPFTCHIGGEDASLGNYYAAGNEFFITEACEFQRSFLALKSEIGVVLNCDRDHTDCYKSDGETAEAYRLFAARAKRTVVNADDPVARSIPHDLDFGFHNGRVRAERIRAEGERYSFDVTEGGMPVVRVRLNVIGRVHVLNALAAYCAARLCGLSPAEIKRGLEAFQGVKRRFERVGSLFGAPMICDYAHHPREIASAIATAQRLCNGTVRVVFQPHTFTRTRDLMRDFVAVLGRADAPIVYRTYAAREAFDFAGSAVTLASKIASAVYVQSPEQLRARLENTVGADDLILVLGAGDIYDVARAIADPV